MKSRRRAEGVEAPSPGGPKTGDRLEVEPLGPPDKEVYLVLDPESPSWALVNGESLQILDLCDGRHGPQAMASEIAARQGADEGAVRPQIDSFLEQVHAAKLVDTGPWRTPGVLPEKNRFHSLAIEITRACNLQCRHCYLAAGEPGARELDGNALRRVIRQVKDAGGISVSIGGGEPLLRPDWRELVEYALSLDLMVAVGTNGTLVDRQLAETLAALPIKLQLSLDGASAAIHDGLRGEGSFDRTLAAIRLLRDAGKGEDLVIAFTPMRPNLAEVDALIDLMTSLEIRVIQFPPLARSGRARENWDALAISDDQRLAFWRTVYRRSGELRGRMDLLADCFSLVLDRPGVPYRCSIGSQLRMDPEGNLYPCQCFHSGAAYRLGNVRETSIGEVVAGQRLRTIIERCLTRPECIESCRHCRWMNFCGAGCMGNAYECSGNALTPDACSAREGWLRELFAARIGCLPARRDQQAPAPASVSPAPLPDCPPDCP